jgi:hypothetical protein
MAGMGDGAPPRVDRFAAVAPSAQGSLSESPASPIRYPVNVYRVLQSLSTIYVSLFQKPWEIPRPAGPGSTSAVKAAGFARVKIGKSVTRSAPRRLARVRE